MTRKAAKISGVQILHSETWGLHLGTWKLLDFSPVILLQGDTFLGATSKKEIQIPKNKIWSNIGITITHLYLNSSPFLHENMTTDTSFMQSTVFADVYYVGKITVWLRSFHFKVRKLIINKNRTVGFNTSDLFFSYLKGIPRFFCWVDTHLLHLVGN